MASNYIDLPSFGAGSWKAPVLTALALPMDGNQPGDVRVALDTDVLYIWTGAAWAAVAEADNGISALSGDGVAVGPGPAVLTLATVNANPGAFGSANSSVVLTVNGKGLITAIGTVSIQIAQSQVTNLVTDLAGKQPTGNYITALTGDVTAAGPGSATATLAEVNFTPGIYGSATTVPVMSVNSKGLVDDTTDISIAIPSTQVTDFAVAALAAVQSSLDAKLNLSGGVLGGPLVIEGDLDGTGYLDLRPQANQPAAPFSGTRLFTTQDEKLAFKGQSGNAVVFNDQGLTEEREYTLPDQSGPLMVDPTSTAGDMIYQNGGLQRLPIGTENQKLKVTTGLPTWADDFEEMFSGKITGNLTVTGALTLTNDVFYDTLTLNAGAALDTAGYKIFCRVLNLSNAPAAAIRRRGNNGNNAANQTGGGTQAGLNATTTGGGGQGGAGATGVVGAGTTSAVAGSFTNANGGNGGSGGNGGAGSGGAGGPLSALPVATSPVDFSRIAYDLLRGAVTIGGGAGGRGGSSGGGDGVNLGRGGGGGGSSGAVIAIYAHTIITSGSTAAGAITVVGGNGGLGASGVAGNVGGGGGGGGAGGGYVYLMYAKKTGPVVTNLITASGGNGGNAGNGIGTGIGGTGGGGGNGGRIQTFNVSTATGTSLVGANGTAGAAGVGVTGGIGGPGGACVVSL